MTLDPNTFPQMTFTAATFIPITYYHYNDYKMSFDQKSRNAQS